MAEETIENRVYLFDSLASAYLQEGWALLSSRSPEERGRALRALADLAWVSCVVSDTAELDAGEVRKRVLEGAENRIEKPAGRGRRR